jgi:hypothetical protein
MVWVQAESREGWGCSLCDWILTTPELDTTVAALKYNRIAQQNFDTHECYENAKKPFQGIDFVRSAHAGHF